MNLEEIVGSETVDEQLLQLLMGWIQNVFGYDDEKLPQYFRYASRGTIRNFRELMPFVVYWFPVLDMHIGQDELIPRPDEDGYALTGGRGGVVSMIGFGKATGELLTRLRAAAIPEFNTEGFDITPAGPKNDISEFTDASIDQSWAADFNITYRISSDGIFVPAKFAQSTADIDFTIQ